MLVGYVWDSYSWEPYKKIETTLEEFEFDKAERDDEKAALESDKAFLNQMKNKKNINKIWFARYKKDGIDAIVEYNNKAIYFYEYKNLDAPSTLEKYSESQLYEEIKQKYSEYLCYKFSHLNPKSIFIRYFNDNKKIAFEVSSLNFDNREEIPYNPAFLAGKSQKDRDKQVPKPAFFLPNNKALKGGFVDYE